MCRVCVCAFSCVYPVSVSVDMCVSQHTSGQKTALGVSPHFTPWFRQSLLFTTESSQPTGPWASENSVSDPPPCSSNPGVADACCDIQQLSGSGNLSAHLIPVQWTLSPRAITLSTSLTAIYVSGWFYLPSDELLIIEENLQIPDQSVCCVVDEAEAHRKKKAF